jgi:hypothetical protein
VGCLYSSTLGREVTEIEVGTLMCGVDIIVVDISHIMSSTLARARLLAMLETTVHKVFCLT